MTTEQQARERKVLDAVPRGLYIDGSWRDASGGRELTVEDPATQESLCRVADASAADAAAALDAAASAQDGWAATPARERGEILRRDLEMLIGQAAQNVLRVSMELGGNAPFLVFADADIDAAVEGAMIAKMRNMGESCVAANRFHVAEPVAEEFAAKLAAKMGGMTVGRGTEAGVDVGPLIDDDQRGRVVELVEDAVGRGAR